MSWIRAVPVAPMLLINRNVVAGLFNKTSEVLPYGIGYHTQYMASKNLYVPKSHKSFPCYSMNGVRTYSEKVPGPVPPSPPPTPPNLPDRAQLERAFFRVVAFFWDYGLWLFAWTHKMIRSYVVEKPMVKLYWKRFHEKMEEAKKDI